MTAIARYVNFPQWRNPISNLRKKHCDFLEQGFDVIVGIPSYNNQDYVGHVVKTAGIGVKKYLKDLKSLIFVCDGGSRDDTREVAAQEKIPTGIERLVSTYLGLPGKGSAVMAILEAADYAGAEFVLLFDADLRSITPDWIKSISKPIQEDGFDYLTPYYLRHKHDGTITNNIVYPVMRGVFGADIRQPIGGDFGIGKRMIKTFLKRESYNHLTARFGIDVWMTTQALIKGKVGQVGLGVKIHAPKDPKGDLTPMFVQVVGTLYRVLVVFNDVWLSKKKFKIPIISDDFSQEVEDIPLEPMNLITEISYAIKDFYPLYKKILSPETLNSLVSSMDRINPDTWARIVYDFAVTFKNWERNHKKLIRILTPLYLGRAGSFALEAKEFKSYDAEELIRKNAECFGKLKPYLKERWKAKKNL